MREYLSPAKAGADASASSEKARIMKGRYARDICKTSSKESRDYCKRECAESQGKLGIKVPDFLCSTGGLSSTVCFRSVGPVLLSPRVRPRVRRMRRAFTSSKLLVLTM